MRRSLTLLALSALWWLPVVAEAQAAGDLDPGFGDGGRVALALSTTTDGLRTVEIDPLGRIVGAGWARSTAGTGDDFAIVRLLADGTPDPAFGGGDGVVVLPLTTSEDTVFALAVQPDGRILAGGRLSTGNGSDSVVVRLELDGDLDPTFGGDGRVEVTVTAGFEAEQLSALALDADGSIYGAGYGSDDWDLWVFRLSPGGVLDTTYGEDGIARVNPGPLAAYLRAAEVDALGRLVVAGSYDTIHQVLVARLDAAGDLDSSLGGDGIVTYDLGPGVIDSADDLALDAEGRIVLGGTVDRSTPTRDDLLAVRLEVDGSLDPSFGGGDGWVAIDTATTGDHGEAVALDGEGRIVLAGYRGYYVSNQEQVVVARLTAAGEPDPEFGGGDGWVTYDVAPNDSESLFAVDVAPTGRIVAAGRAPSGDTGYDVLYLGLHGGCLFCDGFASGDTSAWSLAQP